MRLLQLRSWRSSVRQGIRIYFKISGNALMMTKFRVIRFKWWRDSWSSRRNSLSRILLWKTQSGRLKFRIGTSSKFKESSKTSKNWLLMSNLDSPKSKRSKNSSKNLRISVLSSPKPKLKSKKWVFSNGRSKKLTSKTFKRYPRTKEVQLRTTLKSWRKRALIRKTLTFKPSLSKSQNLKRKKR